MLKQRCAQILVVLGVCLFTPALAIGARPHRLFIVVDVSRSVGDQAILFAKDFLYGLRTQPDEITVIYFGGKAKAVTRGRRNLTPREEALSILDEGIPPGLDTNRTDFEYAIAVLKSELSQTESRGVDFVVILTDGKSDPSGRGEDPGPPSLALDSDPLFANRDNPTTVILQNVTAKPMQQLLYARWEQNLRFQNSEVLPQAIPPKLDLRWEAAIQSQPKPGRDTIAITPVPIINAADGLYVTICNRLAIFNCFLCGIACVALKRRSACTLNGNLDNMRRQFIPKVYRAKYETGFVLFVVQAQILGIIPGSLLLRLLGASAVTVANLSLTLYSFRDVSDPNSWAKERIDAVCNVFKKSY